MPDSDKTEAVICTMAGGGCNQPAIGTYHGIGGSQPCCVQHAAHLRARWGIKVAPMEQTGV